MEATTANLNTTGANGTTGQPNFVTAALSAFSNFNHNNAVATAGLLARLGATRHMNNLNSLNNNSPASGGGLTNGSALNGNPLNSFASGHFANLAAAAAISPYSLPSSYADFYHNFNLLNQQQQALQADTSQSTNSSPVQLNAGPPTTNQNLGASLINQASNGLYSIDSLLNPSMLNSANLIAHLSNGTLPAAQQFAKNSSLESVLREAAETGLKHKKGLLNLHFFLPKNFLGARPVFVSHSRFRSLGAFRPVPSRFWAG